MGVERVVLCQRKLKGRHDAYPSIRREPYSSQSPVYAVMGGDKMELDSVYVRESTLIGSRYAKLL